MHADRRLKSSHIAFLYQGSLFAIELNPKSETFMKSVLRVWPSLALLVALSMCLSRPVLAQGPLSTPTALTTTLAPAGKITPCLKADEAVQIAATFCQKMGLSVAPGNETARAETLFPDNNPYPLSPSYIQALWRVIFPRVATVRVDDQTEHIAFYSDDLLWGRHARDARPLINIIVATQEQVMENALVALEAMSLQALSPNENLVLEQLQVRQSSASMTVPSVNSTGGMRVGFDFSRASRFGAKPSPCSSMQRADSCFC